MVGTGLGAIFGSTKVDLVCSFQMFTESSGGNTQDTSWLYPQSVSVDPSAVGPVRLHPDCSLGKAKDQVVRTSSGPSSSYLPLKVLGVHCCGAPWADQGHGCISGRRGCHW